MIRSIDFYDELAKWTAIEVIKGIGQCVETVSGIDDRRKAMVFNEFQQFLHIASRAEANAIMPIKATCPPHAAA
jgi:hypothetical protein